MSTKRLPPEKQPIPRALVEQMQQLRLDRDWTYQELADAVGVSRGHLFLLLRTPGARTMARTLARMKRRVAAAQREQVPA